MSLSFSINLNAINVVVPDDSEISEDQINIGIEVDAQDASSFLEYDSSKEQFSISRGSTT